MSGGAGSRKDSLWTLLGVRVMSPVQPLDPSHLVRCGPDRLRVGQVTWTSLDRYKSAPAHLDRFIPATLCDQTFCR